ncbi:class I SAM-dependent methyltransferase [Haladaptatus sp. GCM10025707]|uniref:class I SAM-dependent methyltransferase n=1 Tax=unclassified Haladaptatus TaxID=2622732 RepID=UPI0023E7B655|nr:MULTISPECIES: class I SAM-dependent methyltransferase [unclassified Haladaptatus]
MNATYADETVIEWNEFYENGEYERIAYIGEEAMPKLLHRFFERHGAPGSFASIGCGPAAAEFDLAPDYPNTEFYGYDISQAVIDDNAAHAAREKLDNMHFDVASLPNLGIDRQFDVVYCLATLYFVDGVDKSVKALYNLVEPGGYLIFNYPNRYTMWTFDEAFEGSRRDLFHRVVEGKNLLSYERIRNLLGANPRSYWTFMDAADLPFVGRDTPCVYLRKPLENED